MRLMLFSLLSIICQLSFSQPTLTKMQINRLADAGKIYGYVKYFHPSLQYKDINWDSAFAANVDGIIRAHDTKEYAAVLETMFSSLNDGLTNVAHIPGEDKDYVAQPLTHEVKDSTLYVRMNDAPFMTTDEAFYRAMQNISKVKTAVIDMRRPQNSQYYHNMLGNREYFDWSTSWFTGTIAVPSFRSVTYGGFFPNEGCSGCSNVAFKENLVSRASGELDKIVPLVFIAGNEDEVPLLAIKLQEKGGARILVEEGKNLLPGATIYFYTTDSLLIQMRTGEAMNTDGSLLFVHADATFSKRASFDAVIAQAKSRLEKGGSAASKQEWLHPMPVDHNVPYSDGPALPSVGYRMLAIAKMFTVIDHFYTSKSSMHTNWETAYKAAIPKFIAAQDSLAYWKAVAELHALIEDSHGFVSKSNEGFSLRLHPLIQNRGSFVPPVFTQVVENKLVIAGIFNDSVCSKIGIGKGDIVLSVDGQDPMRLLALVQQYQNGGNKGSRDFYLGSFVLFGKQGQVKRLRIQDTKGKIKQVMMPLLQEFKGDWMADKYVAGMFSHNHQPIAKFLTKDVGYADLTSGLSDVPQDSILRMLDHAKAFIFDLRGYPQGSDALLRKIFDTKTRRISPEIYSKLTGDMPASSPNVTAVARWGTPGTRDEFYTEYLRNNKKIALPVKFVVLTSSAAQSSGDYFTITLKTICNATLIGSPTAGANSYFVNYNIPGNIRLWLSGMPIHRAGIQPDIFIKPTLKGMKAGKDEVLERAIKFILTGK